MMTRLLNIIFAFNVVLATIQITTLAHASEAPSQKSNLASLFGQNQKSKFLPVHQAFNVSVTQDGEKLSVAFVVTPEHYVYQDKLTLKLPDGVSANAWQFDKTPTTIDDPTFGKVAVFEENVVASTTLSTTNAISNAPIVIKWQGCAKAGLCYPPETINATITLKSSQSTSQNQNQPNQPSVVSAPSVAEQTLPAEPSVSSDVDTQSVPSVAVDNPQIAPTDTPANFGTSQAVNPMNVPQAQHDDTLVSTGVFGQMATANSSADVGQIDPAQASSTQTAPTINHTLDGQADPFGINERPLVAVGLLFLLGLLLALTPCVYPMIPIVANIVARNQATTRQGLLLSASYGVGVACAYGILGMIIAWFGQALGIVGHLQNPYVLGVFALLFLVLALAMFDVIQLKLPSTISNFLQQKSQSADKYLGSMSGSFLAGLLSALVVSPCVSLPMAGALSAVATTQNIGLGFIMLFMLGLGLSVPLVIMGTLQGKFMPKSGAWTLYVKEFCALLLLAVAVSLTERIWVSSWVLVAWAVWFALLSVWLYRVGVLFARAMAMVAAAWVLCLMVGAGLGNADPWQPLSVMSTNVQTHNDLTITTLDELDEILMTHDKVLVDITATWCVECRIMERTLFSDRPDELKSYQVVKLDITQTTDDSRAVLARYGLFGPPALLIYHQAKLKNMLLGETKRADFIQALSL